MMKYRCQVCGNELSADLTKECDFCAVPVKIMTTAGLVTVSDGPPWHNAMADHFRFGSGFRYFVCKDIAGNHDIAVLGLNPDQDKQGRDQFYVVWALSTGVHVKFEHNPLVNFVICKGDTLSFRNYACAKTGVKLTRDEYLKRQTRLTEITP